MQRQCLLLHLFSRHNTCSQTSLLIIIINMLRFACRNRTPAILSSYWHVSSHPVQTLRLEALSSRLSLVGHVRSISGGILGEKQNITFKPAASEPAVAVPDVPSAPVADVTNQIDLTQFLSVDPSTTARVISGIVEKAGPITATDVGLAWYLPTGRHI